MSAACLWASETCSIEVDGLLYHHGDCRYSEELGSDRYWTVEVGQQTEDESLGYWVLLLEHEDGTFDAHWNGSYGATRAHNNLGTLQRQDDCWIGDRARICLGVQVGDVPVYRVVRGVQSPIDNIVEANVGGTRYVIDHHSWEFVGPYRMGETADLDGDGYNETLVYVFSGGNGDPGGFTVISYRGNGFFSVVNEEPISSGWLGLELVPVGGEVLIRVHDQYLGFGGYQDHETKTDYALRDGKLVEIVERLNVGKTVGLVELTAEEVRNHPNQKKSIAIDLNLDGQVDDITCSYWDRWGSLSCKISHAGSEYVSSTGCKRLAVLPQVIDDVLVIDCGRED
jgi:hypothetical protein